MNIGWWFLPRSSDLVYHRRVMPSEIVPRALGRCGLMRLTRFSVSFMVAGLVVLGLVAVAAPQGQAAVPRLLRIEWEQVTEACCPPRLVGQIHNGSTYRVGSIRLRVETLGGSNQGPREKVGGSYGGGAGG